MIYDVIKKAVPTILRLVKGTECMKIVLLEASKDR